MQKWKLLKYNEIKTERVSEFETVFNIEPLERGFGSTIGTALRRTMLSSIISIAPFAIKIAEAKHEFQGIPGVKEDIQKIILNIKKLAFSYDREIFKNAPDHIIKCRISSKKGYQRTILASEIVFPEDPTVRVVNSDLEIATVDQRSNFEMEIFLLEGRGFVDFSDNKTVIDERISDIKSDLSAPNLIAIDSDFSPVRKIEMHVVEINSSSVKVEERLQLKLHTDGSISGQDVMMQAAKILIAHLQIISNLENLDKIDLFEDTYKSKTEASSSSKHIKDLNLSVRSVNALLRNGYNTLKDISSLTEDDLAAVKNLGKKSIKEIIETLKEHNVYIREGDE